MPTSDMSKVPAVIYAVTALRPKTILEIGCGFGKYGALLRERLDVHEGRICKDAWQIRIDACEVFEAYRSPLWDCYDNVQIGDIRDIAKTLNSYDVILMTDVIEHFTKEDGFTLLNALVEKSRGLVLTTPKKFFPQQDWGGNEFERHRSLWSRQDFSKLNACVIDITENDWMAVVTLSKEEQSSVLRRRYPYTLRKRAVPIYRDFHRIITQLPTICGNKLKRFSL